MSVDGLGNMVLGDSTLTSSSMEMNGSVPADMETQASPVCLRTYKDMRLRSSPVEMEAHGDSLAADIS